MMIASIDKLVEGLPIAVYCHQHWVCWKAVPRGDGKTDKLPINPHTGAMAKNDDPTTWGSFDTARTMLESNPSLAGLGFVFTPEIGMFFVDIDDALTPENQWNLISQELMRRLPGAFVEVSQSGRGLHIIGTGTPPIGRKCKADGFDIYPSDRGNRFAALTGAQSSGSDATNLQAELIAVFNDYLGERVSADVDLTSGPRDDWMGPENDEELLNKAMRSRSMRSSFGAGVTFAQLWRADADKLSEAFPHDQGTEPFDHSRADASLCQHLAYWTGCDAERMDRLFRLSSLMRDKWEQRPDYAERTITIAISQQGDVYRDPQMVAKQYADKVNSAMTMDKAPAAPSAPIVEGKIAAPEARTAGGAAIYSPDIQLQMFEGCVYVASHNGVLMPNGAVYKPDTFNAMMPGGEWVVSVEKPVKKPFDAFVSSQFVSFPKADRMAFRPEKKPREIFKEDGYVCVNAYIPCAGQRIEGDVSPFLHHIETLFPDDKDRDLLMSWCAAIVQKPGIKAKWSPVLIGTQGNGKSLIGEVMSYAVGRNATVKPRADKLGGQFNSWVENKLLAVIEEVYTQGRRELMDALKPVITDSRVEVEGKGRDAVMMDNRCNMLMCSNHRDAIMKTKDDRRYAIFYCAQQSSEDKIRDGLTGNYFTNLFGWLEAGGYGMVAAWLDRYPVNANVLGDAPHTSGTDTAIEESRSPAQQTILDAVELERPGFCGGLIMSDALDVLLTSAGFKIAQRAKGSIMQELGYIRHPSLPDGKMRAPSGVIRVYVKKGHLAESLDGSSLRSHIAKTQFAA